MFPDVLAQAAKHRAVERHELGTALQAARLGGQLHSCVGQVASSQLDFRWIVCVKIARGHVIRWQT